MAATRIVRHLEAARPRVFAALLALSPELNELGWTESLNRLEQYLGGRGASA